MHLSLSIPVFSASLFVSEKGIFPLLLQTIPYDYGHYLLPQSLCSAACKMQTPLPNSLLDAVLVLFLYHKPFTEIDAQKLPLSLMPRDY